MITLIEVVEEEMQITKIEKAYYNGTEWWFACYWGDGTCTPQTINDLKQYDCLDLINIKIGELFEKGRSDIAEILIKEFEKKFEEDYEKQKQEERNEEIQSGLEYPIDEEIPDDFWDTDLEF